MSRTEKINLTESITLATETLRQALEVYLGKRVRFTGPLLYKGGKIEEDHVCVRKFRKVEVSTSFDTAAANSETISPFALVADLQMVRHQNSGWRVLTIEIKIDQVMGPLHLIGTWGVPKKTPLSRALFSVDPSEIYISANTGTDSTREIRGWFVGHDHTDRVFIPNP